MFYYLTVGNANAPQPSMGDADVEGIRRGLHRLPQQPADAAVQLLGSGAIMSEVLRAQQLLREDFGIDAAVWSATSYAELQRDGMAVERARRLGGESGPSWLERTLGAASGPVIAASDYVRAWPELIRAYLPQRYLTLGTDGFGRSDSREGLRAFFEVDAESIVIAALGALATEGAAEADRVASARVRYRRSAGYADPWSC